MGEAYARVSLVEQGRALQTEVAAAFGVDVRTVRRDQGRFESGGLAALGRSAGYPKGAPRLLPLLRAISRGDFILNGFRNRDILPLLFPDAPTDAGERRKWSAKVSYLLRILRGHGLIKKVEGTHRYLVTDKARQLTAAVLATDQASISRLKKCA